MDWIVGSRSSSVAPAPQGKDANPGKMLPGRTPSDSLHSVPTGSRHGPQRAGVDEATRMLKEMEQQATQSFAELEQQQGTLQEQQQKKPPSEMMVRAIEKALENYERIHGEPTTLEKLNETGELAMYSYGKVFRLKFLSEFSVFELFVQDFR